MAQWHIVVSASAEYLPGLRVFVKSLRYFHPQAPIKLHVLGYGLADAQILWLIGEPDTFPIRLSQERPQIETCQLERFRYGAALEGVVMLADADSFFCADMSLYFRLAEAGAIVAGANGMPIGYDAKWREQYGLPLPDGINPATITSTPTILDTARHGDLWRELYAYRRRTGKGDDFTLQHMFLSLLGKTGDVLMLPSQQVTGIHHFQVKPNTRAIEVGGRLMTEDGLPILMIHGKWWDAPWLDGLLRPMETFAAGDDNIMAGARASMTLLKREFDRWSAEE